MNGKGTILQLKGYDYVNPIRPGGGGEFAPLTFFVMNASGALGSLTLRDTDFGPFGAKISISSISMNILGSQNE